MRISIGSVVVVLWHG